MGLTWLIRALVVLKRDTYRELRVSPRHLLSQRQVESLVAAAGMSRSAFAARFQELLGQTPLEYVTEWRMQKAVQLLQQHDKKFIDLARSVGYESDAAFSKAFKRVVGANTGEYIKRGFEGRGNTGMAEVL